MALYKVMPTKFGIDGSYIRIAQTNIDWTTMMAHVEVLLYVDQKIRSEGNNPIDSKSFDMSIMPYIGLNIGPVYNVAAVVYGILKTLPEFEGAEDIIEKGQEALQIDEMEDLGTPVITPIDGGIVV